MTLSTEVPDIFDVAIDGRPYMLDTSEPFLLQTVPLIRGQADNAERPGEHSINPEELWRRAWEGWHHGAGQTNFDRSDSDPFRFRQSKGVDIFSARHELRLLKRTSRVKSSANTNVRALPVGQYVYLANGTSLVHVTNMDAWTTETSADIHNGEAAQTVQSIATDGFNVWAALGANGIHTTTRGATASTHYGDNPAGREYSLVAYVKGRLMAAAGRGLYNLVASGAAPPPLFDHPNTDWTWVGFAEGPGHIYAAGYSGDKSLIYRTAVTPDGTQLDVPVVAGELPDGEIVRTIQGYLGFLLVGTDKGWRLMALNESGDVAGSSDIIPTPHPVRCFEPQDRFVWFGWSNFDAVSTGLGRADLSVFTDGITPAYASDLMASGSLGTGTTQGDVLSVITFAGRRLFTVSGDGVYVEAPDSESLAVYVSSGTIDSGFLTFDLPDQKVSVFLDTRFVAVNNTSLRAALAVDGVVPGDSDGLGQVGGDDVSAVFFAKELVAEKFEVRLTLVSSVALTTTPRITRATLQTYPTPVRSFVFQVPLLLHETLDVGGQERHVDVDAELAALSTLVRSGRLVEFQEGASVHRIQVQDLVQRRGQPTADRKARNSTTIVQLKKLGGFFSTFQAASTQSTASAASLATAWPAGLQDRDVVMAAVAVATSTATITTPAGWTLIASTTGTNMRLSTYYRVANASDAPPTFAFSASVVALATLGIHRGLDGLDLVEAFSIGGPLNNTVSTVAAVTTTAPTSTLVLPVFLRTNQASPFMVNGLASKSQQSLTTGGFTYFLDVGDAVQEAVGSSGSKSSVGSLGDWLNILIALNPA